MSLLEQLFPGLLKGDWSSIPHWEVEDKPWEILSTGDSGLISQITDFTGREAFIHPDAKIGDFVRIEGPCYIGANAEIRHSAYIRKGSWICEGAVVGHSSEVKNSILLPDSKAPHFNYVGDSILGSNVNLGAGVKLSNLRNDGTEIYLRLEELRITTYCALQLGCIPDHPSVRRGLELALELPGLRGELPSESGLDIGLVGVDTLDAARVVAVVVVEHRLEL